VKRIADYFSLVKFSHSVFALPFALQSAWLAAGGVPAAWTLFWIVFCAVAARTAAMGFNRLVDRAIDARNPRTAQREIPAGKLGVGSVRVLVCVSSLAFIAGAFSLNPLAGWLSFPVLLVLLGYSLVKRFSAAAHLALGLALALAPLGAWVAVRGEIAGDLAPVLWLALSVLTWVAGFDLIYACQDADFDRAEGLHSIPARFGIRTALRVSAVLHVFTVFGLASFWATSDLGWIHALATILAAGVLLWEHSLVKPDDLSRVDMAFFTLNGWMGVGLFLSLALDLALL
jgi:4-hydroxybenzoate polyprenyltransferase